MLAIASVTFPFFALIAIGYAAARTRVLPTAAVPGLNVFVLYFALTAMLFQVAAETPVARLLDPTSVSLWLVAGLVIITLGVVPARRRGMPWLDTSFGGLIASQSNSGFMGLPLLIALLGPAAAGPVTTTLLVDIVVLQSIAVTLSRRDSRGASLGAEVVASLRRAASNPLPWAIVAGAAWGAIDLTLPGPVAEVVSLLAAAATPVALFTIGAVLARPARQKETTDGAPGAARTEVLWLAGLKLVAHPALVWGLGVLALATGLPLDADVLVAMTLVAALPAAANITLLAERFGADGARIAHVILVSTVVSVVSFVLVAGLLT